MVRSVKPYDLAPFNIVLFSSRYRNIILYVCCWLPSGKPALNHITYADQYSPSIVRISWISTQSAAFMSLYYSYLPLLLIINFGKILACPPFISTLCACEDLQNGIVLNCSMKQDATSIVKILQAKQSELGLIQELIFRHTNLTNIPAAFFSGLFVRKLDLSTNRLNNINQNAFIGMNSVLQELLLDHNELVELPSTPIAPLTSLIRLDLSNNLIRDLQPQNAFPPLLKVWSFLNWLFKLEYEPNRKHWYCFIKNSKSILIKPLS